VGKPGVVASNRGVVGDALGVGTKPPPGTVVDGGILVLGKVKVGIQPAKCKIKAV